MKNISFWQHRLIRLIRLLTMYNPLFRLLLANLHRYPCPLRHAGPQFLLRQLALLTWASENNLLCRDEESSTPLGIGFMNFTLKVYLWVANTVLQESCKQCRLTPLALHVQQLLFRHCGGDFSWG